MNLRRLLWLLPLFLLSALPAHAQFPNAYGWCEAGAQNVITSGLQSTTLVQASFPQCTVSVSIHGGGTATIYSNDTGTPLSNPFTATTNGQWQFFAAVGNYDVTLTCSGACVPPSPSPFPITFNEINVGIGSGGGGGSPPVKPAVADGIQYVTLEGLDTNDGLSWGSAKLTWTGACEALPGGSASPPTCGVGAIHIAKEILANPISGAGIWMFGSADPGYAAGVSGWHRYGGPIKTICDATLGGVTNNGSGTCVIDGGSTTDNLHPAIWLSAINAGVEFYGAQVQFRAGVNLMLSVCSNGTNNGSCAVQNVRFDRFQATEGGLSAGLGPPVLIGDGTFWVFFNDYNISGNANNSPTADNGAAVLMTNNTTPSGLISFHQGGFNTGGIKYYAGNEATLLIDGVTTTENNLEAVLWVASGNLGDGNVIVQNAGVSDCNTVVAHCAIVRNDALGAVHISNIAGPTIGYVIADAAENSRLVFPDSLIHYIGALTYPTNAGSSAPIIEVSRTQGNNPQKMFGPAVVPGANLVDIGTHTCATCTVTTGITDPTVIGTGAIQITDSASVGALSFTLSSAGGAVTNDTYVASLWTRSPNNLGYNRSVAFQFQLTGGSDICNASTSGFVQPSPLSSTESGWTHYISLCKVTTFGGTTPTFNVTTGSAIPMQVYAPIVFVMHGYSDDDVLNTALNMGTWDINCPTGQLCVESGILSAFAGSTAFYGTLTHANTANRTYTFPDATGNIPAYTVSPTNLDCVDWSGVLGLLGDVSGKCATYSITPTPGDCVTWAAGPKLGDSGSACGAGGGGMNTNMSNMANPTLMNQTLTPASANTIAVGTAALPFTNFFFGTVANQTISGNTANLTANRVVNWPDATSSPVRNCPAVANQFISAIAVATGICTQANISASSTMPFAYAADTGAANAAVVTLSPALTSYTTGLEVDFLPTAANTLTNPTVNVNGLGAITITKYGTAALQANDLLTTAIAKVIYDGTNFQLQNPATQSSTVTSSSVNTFTNKTINCESTGNNCSEPVRMYFPAGGCNNTTPGNGWDIGLANAPTPQCTGSTTRRGVLQFARGNVAYINAHLPNDLNTGASLDLEICYTTTDTTNGHVTSFNIQTGFNSVTGAATDDPTLNTLQALSSTIGASQTSGGELCKQLTGLTTTGWAADSNFVLAITRNNSGTDTNTDTAVNVKSAEVILGVTKNATNR